MSDDEESLRDALSGYEDIRFNMDGSIDRRCSAYRSGDIYCRQDGSIDRRCRAYRDAMYDPEESDDDDFNGPPSYRPRYGPAQNGPPPHGYGGGMPPYIQMQRMQEMMWFQQERMRRQEESRREAQQRREEAIRQAQQAAREAEQKRQEEIRREQQRQHQRELEEQRRRQEELQRQREAEQRRYEQQLAEQRKAAQREAERLERVRQKEVKAQKRQSLTQQKQHLLEQKRSIITEKLNPINEQKVKIDNQISAEEKAIEGMSLERNDKRKKIIIMVGKTGHGKSTFVNRLYGDKSEEANNGPCRTSNSGNSCTQSLQKINIDKLCIIDCPGWSDSGGADRLHSNNLCKFLKGCGGINAFVLIRNATQYRFDADFKKKLRHLADTFGNEFWNNLIIVLTHVDKGIQQRRFDNNNKAFEMQQEIAKLCKNKNIQIPVIPFGLDNYKDAIQLFQFTIPENRFICNKIKSPIDTLKANQKQIVQKKHQIRSRINKITNKINSINSQINNL